MGTFLLAGQSVQAGLEDQTLDIYWVDAEGGGATLIVTPQGESILIDSGNPGVRDPGRIHHAATTVARLKRIDHLIITHFHIDHFGGAAELAALLPIGTVWSNAVPEDSPDNRPDDTRWRLMSKPFRDMKAESRKVIHPGDTLPLRQPANGTPLVLRCVAAMQKFSAAPESAPHNPHCDRQKAKAKDTSDNANSVVMVLEMGAFRFLDGGDLTWNTEAALVCPVNRVGEVDVYQVNHHGLDQSNNPVLVHSLSPSVAVMNNGPRKGTGGETMATLRSAPSLQAVYQVHRNVREDSENNTKDEFIANLEADCKAQHVKLSLAPRGEEYTLTLPSNGHRATYPTRKDKWVPQAH
jgi:beta-lactamase superfamily II metal-dependent hydrolase